MTESLDIISNIKEKIKKIILVETHHLKPYKNNSRTHSEDQILQIVNSINEFGFTNPILIDENFNIIAGHGRFAAAQKLGFKAIPSIILEGLSAEQKRAYVIADNKIALNAGWDLQTLAKELSDLQLEDFNIDILGFDAEELSDIFDQLDNEEEVIEGDNTNAPMQTVKSKAGESWLLRDHKLVVGDSFESECDQLIVKWQCITKNDAILESTGQKFNAI